MSRLQSFDYLQPYYSQQPKLSTPIKTPRQSKKEQNELKELIIEQLAAKVRQNQAKPKKAPSKKGKGVLNSFINNLPFEAHVPGYNYLGPGTKYEQRITGKYGKSKQIPVNDLDFAALQHDDIYNDYYDVPNRTQADYKLREAAQNIYQSPDHSLGERASAYATDKIIALKNLIGAGKKKPGKTKTKAKVNKEILASGIDYNQLIDSLIEEEEQEEEEKK